MRRTSLLTFVTLTIASASLTVAGCNRHLLGVDEPDGGDGGADVAMDLAKEAAMEVAPDVAKESAMDVAAEVADAPAVDARADGDALADAVSLADVPADGLDGLAADVAGTCAPVTLPVPIAHYTFDDCTDSLSAKLKDSAVDGPADGIRGAGTRCVVGRFGRALYFDGQPGAEVTVPPRPSFQITRVTIAAWLRPSRATDSTILARWFVYDQFALSFDVAESAFLFSVAVPGAGPYGDPFSVRMPAQDETWVHVAASFDGTFVRLYRDGALASELRITGAPRDLQDTAKSLTMAYLEKDSSSSMEPRFRGDMDDVRVYGVALTPAQIARVACGP
jgi:hypothetical protein